MSRYTSSSSSSSLSLFIQKTYRTIFFNICSVWFTLILITFLVFLLVHQYECVLFSASLIELRMHLKNNNPHFFYLIKMFSYFAIRCLHSPSFFGCFFTLNLLGLGRLVVPSMTTHFSQMWRRKQYSCLSFGYLYTPTVTLVFSRKNSLLPMLAV